MSFPFPTTYSTLSSAALGVLVETRYGLAGVQCQFLVRGVGDTYLIRTSEDRFILRVYRSSHRSLMEIAQELEIILAAKQAGVSVSYPIEDLSGVTIQSLEAVEGERHAVLFNYAPGRSVLLLNENQLQDLGRQMAGYHQVAASIPWKCVRWKFDFETTLFRPLEMAAPAFEGDPDSLAWLQQASKKVERRLADIGTTSFSSGWCHFDFLPKNFHFEGDAVTFFDFDFLGYGWLINDIMSFWQHLCLDVRFGRLTQAQADHQYALFLDAYRSVRSVSEAELAAVPYLSLGFWLFYMGFHTTHDQFRPLTEPATLTARTGVIRQLMEKYWVE